MTRPIASSCLIAALVTVMAVPVSASDFVYPLAVVASEDGTSWVADRNLPGIWKVSGGKAEIFFQGEKKFRTPLNAVRCVALDHEGKLLAGDSSTFDIYRFNDEGKPEPLTGGKVLIPMSIAVAKDGTIYVADLQVHRIWKIPAAGGKPEEYAVINSPRGLAFDAEGRLWVLSTSSKDGQIQRVLPDGKLETVVAGRPFQMPHKIVLGDDNTAYVSDNYANTIWKVPPGGKPEKWAEGAPMVKPVGLARAGADLLIADPHAKALFRATPDGKLTKVVE